MATKNYAISADPQLMALRSTVAALTKKQDEVKAIIARLANQTNDQDFNAAVNAVMAGADPVAAAAALDNATAQRAAEESLRLVDAAITRARTAAAAEERHARDRYLDRIRPQYQATAKRFAVTLMQLTEVQADFYALEKKYSDEGLPTFPAGEMGPFGMRALGDIRDENSVSAQWLIGAASHGVIALSDIPSGITAGWRILTGLQKNGSLPAENPSRTKLKGLPASVSLTTHRVRSLDRSYARAGR